MKALSTINPETLYLVYDGDCWLCNHSAQAMQLNKTIQNWQLINARKAPQLVNKLNEQGINLNQGMAVLYQHQIWAGSEAIHKLACLSSDSTRFNRLAKVLFKHKTSTQLLYPILTTIRHILLLLRRKKPLPFTPSIHYFSRLFEPQAADVFHKRYAIHFGRNESVHMDGLLDIQFSWLYRLLRPIFKKSGALFDQQGLQIKTHVVCGSTPGSKGAFMDRSFFFPNSDPIKFHSDIIPTHKSSWLEVTSKRYAWKFQYQTEGDTLIMRHEGFGILIAGHYLPLPGLSLLLGKPHGEETALDPHSFKMKVIVRHWLSKELIRYEGVFHVKA